MMSDGRMWTAVLLILANACQWSAFDPDFQVDPKSWQSVGCYVPFDLDGSFAISSEVAELRSCTLLQDCQESDYLILRGGQCGCVGTIENLIRINDSYCSFQCNKDSHLIVCGGNFGASVYCNNETNPDCGAVTSPLTSLPDSYPQIGSAQLGCRPAKCGVPGEDAIYEHFPNLTIGDCTSFCAYMQSSFALLGWQLDYNQQPAPYCACSNDTEPVDDISCNGYCYDIFDRRSIDKPCGDETRRNLSWSVFCTGVEYDEYCTSLHEFKDGECSNGNEPEEELPCSPEPLNMDSPGIILNCDRDQRCYPNECFFNETCYRFVDNGKNLYDGDGDPQSLADQFCQNHGGGLLAIETEEEQDFVAVNFDPFHSIATRILTASRWQGANFFWHINDTGQSTVPLWVQDLLKRNTDVDNQTAFVFLEYVLGEGYARWNLSTNIDEPLRTFICEYPAPQKVPICTTRSERSSPSEDTTTMLVTTWSIDNEVTSPESTTTSETTMSSETTLTSTSTSTTPSTIPSTTSPTTLSTSTATSGSTSASASTRLPTISSTEPSTSATSGSTSASTSTRLPTISSTEPSTLATPGSTSASTPTSLPTISSKEPSTSATPGSTSASTSTSLPTISSKEPSTSATPGSTSTTTSASTSTSTPTRLPTTSSTKASSSAAPATPGSTTTTTSSGLPVTSTTNPSTSTSTSATATISSATTQSSPRCQCHDKDIYGFDWVAEMNTWVQRSCSEIMPVSEGSAYWFCAPHESGCAFSNDQPNFSDCRSNSLQEIEDSINNSTIDLKDIWLALNLTTKPNNTYFGHEIDSILRIIRRLLDRQDEEFQASEDALRRQIQTEKSGTHVMNNVISNAAQWHQLSSENRSLMALRFIETGDDISFRLVNVSQTMNVSLQCESTSHLNRVVLSSSFWNRLDERLLDCDLEPWNTSTRDVILKFPQTSLATYLILPEEVVEDQSVHTGTGMLIDHAILNLLLPGRVNSFNDDKKINSPMISYTLKSSGSIFEKGHVSIYFNHSLEAKNPPVTTVRRLLKPGEVPSPVIGSSECSFLHFPNDSSWQWANHGCSVVSANRTLTICRCDHLTGFANLMDFHNYTGVSLGLEVTSIVCSSLSVIGLATTIFVLSILRSIKNDRTIITQNLCASLLLTHILSLTTLNKHYFNLDDVACSIFGVILHLVLLISFMWMAVEGLRLCHLVVDVFNHQKRDFTLIYIVAAYGIPVIIVGITIIVAHFTTGIISAYVGDETCWLNGENYKWAFAGPVAFILVMNVGFIAVAARWSWNLKKNENRETHEKVWSSARLCLSLTGMLGISWLSGYLLFIESDVFAYIFTLSNGLQGVVILLFRCILNSSVRTAFRDQWTRKRRNTKLQREVGNVASTRDNRRLRNSTKVELDGAPSIPKVRYQSKLSITSRLTRSTNITASSSSSSASGIEPNFTFGHRHAVRTFSGTEYLSECSSFDRESICSSTSSHSTPSTTLGHRPHINLR